MKTLAQYQKGMPPEVKAKHDAMTAARARHEEALLRNESLKCAYFGNDCPMRGPDGLMQASNNFEERANYFKLLAESKE